ncbi:MAG: ATP-binding protein [Woeseiaceae bacterium]
MKSYSVVNSLRNRYIFGLGLLAILISVSYMTMQNIVSQQRNFSQLINIAGHQSGLVNRISYFSSLMTITDDLSEFEMAKSQVGRGINKIKESHYILQNGSEEKSIPFVTNENLKNIYDDHQVGINISLTRFLKHAQKIYKSDINKLNANSIDYIYLTSYGPHILEPILDSAVSEYEKIGNASIYEIERIELIIWLITLLVLIVEAILIFNPLVKKVKLSINSLEKSVAAHEVSENRLLEAQRLASLGDWQLNLNEGTLVWTDEIYRIFGVTRETFTPTLDAVLQRVHPDDSARVKEHLNYTDFNSESSHFEHRIIHSDGSERVVNNQFTVHISDKEKITSLTGTIQDITEQNFVLQELELYKNDLEKLVDERTTALRAACEEAEQANKSKSQFLSNMSHELRTPLNAIIGFSEMLQDYGDDITPDEKEDYIRHVIKGGKHLLRLINEILDLSSIDAGHLDINIQPTHINSIINEIVFDLEVALANKRSINLINQLGEQALTVLVDPLRFKQIIINLISNAVKYNHEGGSVTIRAESLEKETLRIIITDNGYGISVSNMDKLFEPFERLSFKHGNIEGTGIGLTITKQLVESMNGDIGVESVDGKGSTFWIELPKTQLKVLPKEIDTAGLLDIKRQPRKIHKVLYIEDNPTNAQLICDVLKYRGGYEVLTCLNAEQGLTLAEEEEPDIILLDLNLPSIDGLTALNEFKTIDTTKKTPIFAVTAYAMASDIQEGLRVGFDEYITKPIKFQELFLTLDKYLSIL